MPSRTPQASKGSITIIVKDQTGAVTVRIWYRNQKCNAKLGQLLSNLTPFVSQHNSGKPIVAVAPFFVSIFPEADKSCHLATLEDLDDGKLCKRPLDYVDGKPLEKLLTLKDYIDGGHEMIDVKLLVCVKSVGCEEERSALSLSAYVSATHRGIVPNKSKGLSELVTARVFDDTSDACLTLWGDAVSSVEGWIPSSTVLLISSPQAKIHHRTYLSLSPSLLVDVDPIMEDAGWLKAYASRMTKREHVNQSPNDHFTSFLSVVILDMNITYLHQCKMLFCTECCSIPLFSNLPQAICKACNKLAPLRLNRRIVGTLIDETGSIASGKLLWTQTALQQLLGRTDEELAKSSGVLLRYMEKRFAWLRVTLVIGWPGEALGGGRLCVLGVRT